MALDIQRRIARLLNQLESKNLSEQEITAIKDKVQFLKEVR
jgi:hypothetical protein